MAVVPAATVGHKTDSRRVLWPTFLPVACPPSSGRGRSHRHREPASCRRAEQLAISPQAFGYIAKVNLRPVSAVRPTKSRRQP